MAVVDLVGLMVQQVSDAVARAENLRIITYDNGAIMQAFSAIVSPLLRRN